MKTINDGKNPVPRHLDDADLISYLDGELSRVETEYARTHVESCWHCRSQLLATQNNIESFLRLRIQVLPTEIPPSSPAVAQFRRRLAQHASVPVSLPLRLTNWMRILPWRGLLPDFSLALKYKRTAVASALACLFLFMVLVDPLRWNTVSADQLLARADTYEFLHEQPAGKVLRARTQIGRINLSTKVETNLGEIETAEDSLTSALHISAQPTPSGATKEMLTDRDKPSVGIALINGSNPETIKYLNAQSWFPQVGVSSYRRLIAGRGLNGNDGAFAKHVGATYELHHPFVASHTSGITEAVLVLNEVTYAPQGVSVFTVEANEQFEYRLTRVSIERIERTPEVAQLFDAPRVESERKAKSESRSPGFETLNSKPERVIPALAASAELEVEVLGLLNQIGADLGQEVIVTRIQGGVLKVEAVVDTEKRKREILSALASLKDNPAINIQVETTAEAEQRNRRARSAAGTQTGPTSITTESVTNNSIPVQPQVRQYLLARGIAEQQVDTEVGRTANQIVMRSHRAMLHVWALRSLVQRFSTADLKTLNADARAKWLRMIGVHARGFEKESGILRQELSPIFNASNSSGRARGDDEIGDEAHLVDVVLNLIDRASANHEVIRSAFTISTGNRTTSAITTTQFWGSFREAEMLAAKISKQ